MMQSITFLFSVKDLKHLKILGVFVLQIKLEEKIFRMDVENWGCIG